MNGSQGVAVLLRVNLGIIHDLVAVGSISANSKAFKTFKEIKEHEPNPIPDSTNVRLI